jgi:hypothetical protein
MVLALNALTEALPSAQTACLIGIPAGCVVYALVSVGIRSPELAETLAIGKRVMARATKQH